MKSTADIQIITTRIPRELHEYLREYSHKSRTSMNLLVIIALEDLLRTYIETQQEGTK